VTYLRRLRPARRLVLAQGVAAVALALVTLPFSYPGAGDPPTWVQLLGLTFLLGSVGASVYTWRMVVVGGLRQRDDAVPRGAETRLRQHIRDERRLRMAAIIYPLTIFILVPLPPSWRWFWFVLTVLGAIVGAVSMVRLLRSETAAR
jgi:hypothetical protein